MEKREVRQMMGKMVQSQAPKCNWGYWCVYEGRLYKLYNRKAESK